MKANLIVSNCTELWMTNAQKFLFLTESCRNYALTRGIRPEQCLPQSKHVANAEATISFIEDCLTKVLPIVASNLARHHGYPNSFWKRTLFFYLRDLIGSAYTIYEQIESVFDPGLHELKIATLPDKAPTYGVSGTLEDALYWGITDEGREYYAAEYFRHFYPDLFSESPLLKKKFSQVKSDRDSRPISGVIKSLGKAVLRRASSQQLRVMVTNVAYEKKLAKRVFLSSIGRASFYYVIPSLNSLFEREYDFDPALRRDIAAPLTSSQNRFEQYLGRCLETSLPWSLAEGFKRSFAFYQNFWNCFPRLQYVISENLYQQDVLPRAVCALQGVELITFPHIFPLEIYATAKINHLQVQDRFIARGSAQLSPSAVGSGTVYPYCLENKSEQKDIHTLYITTDFYTYFQPLQLSADGSGHDVFKRFKRFVDEFLMALPQGAVEKIALKKRPHHVLNPLQMDYPAGMSVLDPCQPAKTYMGRAKLIIVEGMSTSLFESLVSNIPTIAFWPADLYYLGAEFETYFSALEEVGVIVHDPRHLVQQVERVQQDSDTWWFSPDVQAARNRFMDQSLCDNAAAEKLLVSLARGE